jgi:hypothetical protein
MAFFTNQPRLGLLAALTGDRKSLVWAKGHEIPGMDPAEWRRDAFGHVICFSDYGDRNSATGWEIDHITASALGGSDDLSNLRPLHCRANAGLGGVLGGILKR